MIKVNRNLVAVPEVFLATDDGKKRGGRVSAAKEMRKAKAALEAWQSKKAADPSSAGTWEFKFAVYKHEDVKEALTALFHGKCAYCESRYAATQPMDVEHWRPKARIDGEKGRLGYWYLAAKWENLLPSCIDCNRERKQYDVILGTHVPGGKKDRFPLEAGSPRATSLSEIPAERPLLLHPCDDEPDDYLAFDTKEGSVAPRKYQGYEHRKARESIRVYALNRADLVFERRELLLSARQRLQQIERLAMVLAEGELPTGGETDVKAVIESLLQQMILELRKRAEPTQPYALMIRQLIAEHRSLFEED